MKKISAGYYEGEYKGIRFTIQKVDAIDSSTKNQWYWMINEKGGEDWFNSKKISILAVKEAIDEIIKS